MNIEHRILEAAAVIQECLERGTPPDLIPIRDLITAVLKDKLTDCWQVFCLSHQAAHFAQRGERVACIRELEAALKLARAWHARCEGQPANPIDSTKDAH